MALIKCEECGKEISSYATVCPNCGCPVNGGTSNENEHNSEEHEQALELIYITLLACVDECATLDELRMELFEEGYSKEELSGYLEEIIRNNKEKRQISKITEDGLVKYKALL